MRTKRDGVVTSAEKVTVSVLYWYERLLIRLRIVCGNDPEFKTQDFFFGSCKAVRKQIFEQCRLGSDVPKGFRPFPWHTFSALWLRSSVVSVLESLISFISLRAIRY